MALFAPTSPAETRPWRTPLVVVACACAIALIGFGPRSAVGQFMTPLSMEHGWGRDVFSMALAIQNLLWGLGQPWQAASPTASGRCGFCAAARFFMRSGFF